MLIIGERINSSRKAIYRAISGKDEQFIRKEALSQTQAGAHYIDVNAGQFADKEGGCLAWLIEIVQDATSLPLCIDSPNPRVIKEVLPMVRNPAMINSITLEQARFDALMEVIAAAKPCKVIGLCQSDNGAAHSLTEKMDMAGELIEKLTSAGMALDDIYIDPLTFPLATDAGSAMTTLGAFKAIKSRHPGVHAICGLTNVSYGLPQRKLINRTFLAAAVAMGLDSAIIDPMDGRLMAALRASLLVGGHDPYARGYLQAFRQGILEAQ